MNLGLALAFLFALGAMLGWCIEFLYRNLISHNGPRGKYFINPGLCAGPWLPIYGMGVAAMFTISWAVTEGNTDIGVGGTIGVIAAITITMLIIEFIGGLFLLKIMNLRLWDYRKEPGNIMGIICPKFVVIWGTLGAIYFIFLHKIMIRALEWLSQNLAFSFFVGLFAGVFVLDLVNSSYNAMVLKKFADDNEVIIKYEEFKELVQKRLLAEGGKQKFFVQIKKDGETLNDTLKKSSEAHEKKK